MGTVRTVIAVNWKVFVLTVGKVVNHSDDAAIEDSDYRRGGLV
jgi:hypothetical protein